jgi:tRNA(adenine34) deaminase
MEIALEEANMAGHEEEVPVGAVAVVGDSVIARAHNSVIKLNDPSAHAEMLVLREAGLKLGNYRLTELRLYVTIEPCIMCAGAMINARIKQLVFGAYDNKAGAITLFDLFNNDKLNHRIEVVHGVLEQKASKLLREFFKDKRHKNSNLHI